MNHIKSLQETSKIAVDQANERLEKLSEPPLFFPPTPEKHQKDLARAQVTAGLVQETIVNLNNFGY
jgi:hypothetical protein